MRWLADAGCLGWVLAAVRIVANAARLRGLGERRDPAPAAWPRVSVLVAARDEAAHLEAAAASLLAVDYPDLEIVLVDDRSTDGTGAIVDRLAAADRRVVPVHVGALPAGWLGKVHALEAGRARASGSWLLCTDADVHLAPDALRRAVAAALTAGAGHVSLLPAVTAPGLWLRAAIGAFALGFFLAFDAGRMGKPRSGVMMGVGAFNLVRADLLAEAGGFAPLKLEVVDDVGLAQLLNRSGVRGLLLAGSGRVRLDWYPTLGAMVAGLEKNAFAALRYSAWRAAALAGTVALGVVMLGLSAVAAPAAAAAAWLAFTAAAVFALRRMGDSGWVGALAVPGLLVNAWIVARSATRALARGAVVWRGTAYPLAELRAGRFVNR